MKNILIFLLLYVMQFTNYAYSFNNVIFSGSEMKLLNKKIEENKALKNFDYYYTLNAKGILLKKLGKLEESLKCYNIVINEYKKMSDAFANRGNLYKRMGKYKKSFNDYKKAIKMEKNKNKKKMYYIALGNLFLNNLKKYKSAKKYFKKAIKIDKTFYDAYYNLAYCYIVNKDMKNATKTYKKIVKAAKKANDKNALFKAYCVYGYHNLFDLKNSKKALSIYQTALKLKNVKQYLYNRHNAQIELGISNILTQDYETGVKNIVSGLKYSKNYIDGYYYLGYAFFQLKDLQTAFKYFSSIYDHKKNDGNIHFFMAAYFFQIKKDNKALNFFKRAIELKSDYTDLAKDMIKTINENYKK